MPEPDLIELFVVRLREIGARYLVTGSVAATLYGEPRASGAIPVGVAMDALAVGSQYSSTSIS